MAYSAIENAQENKIGCVILDTSGRLQNNKNLMQELKKTYEVAMKQAQCCFNVLVLDGLLGFNTIDQIKEFNTYLPLDGLIINKVDNISTISGVFLSIAQKFPDLPILFIGNGEKISDLELFKSKNFVNNCFSL